MNAIMSMQWNPAPMEIRDRKLYRAKRGTFKAHRRVKWHYANPHAYWLIGAAEVVATLSPIGEISGLMHEARAVRSLACFRKEFRLF